MSATVGNSTRSSRDASARARMCCDWFATLPTVVSNRLLYGSEARIGVFVTQLGNNESALRPPGRSHWFHPDRSTARNVNSTTCSQHDSQPSAKARTDDIHGVARAAGHLSPRSAHARWWHLLRALGSA